MSAVKKNDVYAIIPMTVLVLSGFCPPMGFKEDLQFRKYTLRIELNIKVYVCNPFRTQSVSKNFVQKIIMWSGFWKKS